MQPAPPVTGAPGRHVVGHIPCVRILGTAVLLLLTVAGNAAPDVREQDIKAVFLFRFLQLVEWPADTFPSENSPIVIGIVAPDPFGPTLDETVHNETVDGRHIVIKRAATAEELLPCHLLFVPQGSVAGDPAALGEQIDTGVLLVGENPEFIRHGGMINFYRQGNQVRFEICPDAAELAGIRIRSRLLRLARIVPCAIREER